MTGSANPLAIMLLVTFVCGCFGASAAQAEGINKLTKENVQAFIEKTSVITGGRETQMTQEQIDAYLIEHINDKARFRSAIRYNIPGFDAQETSMSISKQEFIENIDKAAETVTDYQSDIKILEVKIARDGKNATVKTKTNESGMMPVADDETTEDVPMKGTSTCVQLITLSKKGVIQMYSAACATDIEFESFEPL